MATHTITVSAGMLLKRHIVNNTYTVLNLGKKQDVWDKSRGIRFLWKRKRKQTKTKCVLSNNFYFAISVVKREWSQTCRNVLPVHLFNEQDMQYTYNLTLRRVRKLLLPWKRNKYYIFDYICVYVCVCARARARVRGYSLSYPAYNAYVPYCNVVCGL
jgi:hypothetical protein